MEVGLLLSVVPWTAFWERNYFAAVVPLAGALARNHFVRGAVTGLGVINLAAAGAELLGLFRPARH